jgi:two-component system, NtrC family, sensor kinase
MISNPPTSDGTRVPPASPSDASGRRSDQEGQERMGSVTPIPATRVAIVGAGRGGTALLDLLHQLRTIEVVGIADRNPAAPGLQRARELHVPVYDRIADLIGNQGVNLVMDVTGDPSMDRILHDQTTGGADILSGPASRLLWDLVRHESALQSELLHAEKLAGIGSFAAGIAHDMNNPLQLILGLAENLAEERDIETVHLQARDIIEAVKRTTAICRDLTSYSRRASSQQDSRIAINSKLDEALKIARYAVALQNIEIRKSYQPDVTIRGNPDELLHVFVNLITNAVHAMEQGGTLTLETAMIGGGTQIRVSDTGCGISADLLGRIFEPFFTTKPPGKGTGLGLYNIKNVIHHMHGSIEVESRVGRGSTFTLIFPQETTTEDGSGPS